MMSWDDIQRYMLGAWDLMWGRKQGLGRLDLTVDGFWNSFFAMIVAAPPLLLTWVAVANRLAERPGYEGSRPLAATGFAVIDALAWVLPLVLLALASRRLGIADRFVAYVVSTNWASAVLVWLGTPVALAMLLMPGSDITTTLQLLFFVFNGVLMWRLTNAVIDRGPGMATGVFVAMMFVSIVLVTMLQNLFGLSISP